jgi:microcystin-dependent protein
MSNCSNCYNGCTEIVSDRCVKYTGIDVPVLGIQTGDSLSFVEQALITFLTSTLDGTGIIPIIDNTIICNVVKQYLPDCGAITLNDILSALIQAACTLQEQVDVIDATLATLNADYTLPAGCLTGVTASSDTHAIVQAVINKLCALDSQFSQLLIDLPNTYVQISQLDVLIQAYLDSSTSGLISNKMVPYAVLPYFGPIDTFFDASGAGTGNWNRVFLCNGNNGTPDLRGRALTGVINGVPGPSMSPVVDPGASAANPNYSLFDVAGANQITLLSTQIPAHTHSATAISIDSGHTHTQFAENFNLSSGGSTLMSRGSAGSGGSVSIGTANITTTVTVNPNTGGGLPHLNIQPVTACYYIQYRP